MGPVAGLLPCGTRLHLQHGPIDLVIGADGDRATAFGAATQRFETILQELSTELTLLRRPLMQQSVRPNGSVASRMDDATRPYCPLFITRMAAVAGAVADTILGAMRAATPLRRAYVNNGGDIALYLSEGQRFTSEMADYTGAPLGRIEISQADHIGGMATSGRHGRSLSFGVADSVTVLAATAADADAAATMIANAIDLPNHPAISRVPACDVSPDSDLGTAKVVTGCGALSVPDIEMALNGGALRANQLLRTEQIIGAGLFLQGQTRLIGTTDFTFHNRIERHA